MVTMLTMTALVTMTMMMVLMMKLTVLMMSMSVLLLMINETIRKRAARHTLPPTHRTP